MTQPALVIDGMSMFRSISTQAHLLQNGYTYSFLMQLTSAVKKFKPKGIFVCWEGGFQKRLDILPEYKKDRKPTSDSLKAYREQVKQLIRHLGVDQIMAHGHEADDVGAFLANTLESVVLVSGDKDWLQLVRPGVSLYQKSRNAGGTNTKVVIDVDNFSQLTGWDSPQQYLLGHCALGDAVDNIPKISGIGEPVIVGYWNGAKIDEKKKLRLDQFYAGSPEFLRNKALIDLTQIRELDVELDAGKYDERQARELLTELGFASVLKQYDSWILTYREALV